MPKIQEEILSLLSQCFFVRPEMRKLILSEMGVLSNNKLIYLRDLLAESLSDQKDFFEQESEKNQALFSGINAVVMKEYKKFLVKRKKEGTSMEADSLHFLGKKLKSIF